MGEQDSTLFGVGPQGRAGLWVGRVFLAVPTCFVAAGLLGVLGVHTSSADTRAEGYEVSVDYPRTARAGFDVTWRATITHDGGFSGPVQLAVTADYFDIYETQGFFPEPDSQTRDADTLYLTFAAPPGDTLVVSYDAYIQPSSQIGRDATLAVRENGRDVAAVNFSTWLAP